MTNTFKLYWVSHDCQADLMMGEFDTLEEALNAWPAAKQELLDQGGSAAGFWSIDQRADDDDIIATYESRQALRLSRRHSSASYRNSVDGRKKTRYRDQT